MQNLLEHAQICQKTKPARYGFTATVQLVLPLRRGSFLCAVLDANTPGQNLLRETGKGIHEQVLGSGIQNCVLSVNVIIPGKAPKETNGVIFLLRSLLPKIGCFSNKCTFRSKIGCCGGGRGGSGSRRGRLGGGAI